MPMNKIFPAVILTLCFFFNVEARTITLPYHYVNGKNVLTQDMFKEQGATYIVRYKYDLNNTTIVLPEGAVLRFRNRGFICNGTLDGRNSSVESTINRSRFCNVRIIGSWRVPHIYSKWFEFGGSAELNTLNFRSMCNLSDDLNSGSIHISDGIYKVQVDNKNKCCLSLNSNTELIVDGTIILEGNDLKDYQIIQVKNKKNVRIHGKGTIIGDVGTHTGTTGEWGMGVEILSSQNVEVKDLQIKNCWGDCVYIGQSEYKKESYSRNVTIENVVCKAGRRQGLSLISGKDIFIKNCKFLDTGTIRYTPPGAGMDIEPNMHGNTVVENIVIDGCIFEGNNYKYDLCVVRTFEDASIIIRNCRFANRLHFDYNTYNILVESCDINSFTCVHKDIGNITFKNCSIKKRSLVSRALLQFKNCQILQDW